MFSYSASVLSISCPDLQGPVQLVKERRQLRKHWRKATVDEREGVHILKEELRNCLAALKRAEHLRRKRKEKERVRQRDHSTENKGFNDLLVQ